ncbi:ATP-binding protein [Alloyangia pacifica]|uniref:hybrid sensor histidine kinase/response regulator n=1 Tax=Alloyangia pacifica TaxID=311180 RepID=UPI001CD2ABDE|nr:ATP-binding protein [Alloyangia pacifica]MCA0997807.1 response regulator [Alloyangia pacifica]
MSDASDPSSGSSLPNRKRWAALSAPFIVLCLAALVLLTVDAARQIQGLATANSDNGQWSLAQMEVEFGSLQAELDKPEGYTDPEALRLAFDIFYSRYQTISRGALYADIVNTPTAEGPMRTVREFLQDTVPLIDGPEEDLLAALPELRVRAEPVRLAIREVSLSGVRAFSAASDTQRRKVMNSLVRLSGMALILVLALALGVVALWQLMHVARDQAQRRARANHRLEAVVSTALDGIVVTDGAGRILQFNGAAECISGHGRDLTLGRPASELLFPPGSPEARDLTLSRHAGRGRVRCEGLRADGTRYPMELSVTETEHEGDMLRAVYFRDITRDISAEEELVEARDKAVEGEKAKAHFIAIMSHEMRTPLNGMIGALELLTETELNRDQREYLQILRRAGDVLLQHVNDVLDHTRLETGRFSFARAPFDPVELAREVVDVLRPTAAARGNMLQVSLPEGGCPLMMGDPTRLRQVLVNLMGNAIKFTENGEIHLTLDCPDRTGTLHFEVADNGIGIAEDQQERIFEDFVTLDSSYMRAAEGTGLGLGIVRRLVNAMGGEVSVESTPGMGTRFSVALPAERAPLQALPPAPVQNPQMAPSCILVVEDNPVNRLVANAMLRKMGHTVIEARDGAEGLKIAAEEPFDLVLMDISMPGLDGVETTRRLRAGGGPNAETPIVALTAHALPADIARFREAGMKVTLTKPITWRALTEAIAGIAPVAAPLPEAQGAADMDPQDAPVLDDVALDAAATTLGAELFASLRDRFVSETEDGLRELAKEMRAGIDPTRYAEKVHRIAGSAAVFGASALHAALRVEEERARSSEALPVGSLDAVMPVWQATRRALLELETQAP